MSPQAYSPRQPMAGPSGQLKPCAFRTSSGDETVAIRGRFNPGRGGDAPLESCRCAQSGEEQVCPDVN